MNGDEGIENTPCAFVPAAFPIMGCVDKALPIRYCDCLDVRFALLTVNESRRVCSNYKFLGEIPNMC
jgi:hypothetical protein